jgi:hypothetical protein
MTERARRTIVICGTIATVLTIGTAIATWHVDRFYPVMIFFVVGILYSNQFYVGYIPLPIPGFKDAVAGNMLTGMSEEAATAAASRGMEVQAYGHLFMTAIVCAGFICAAYGVFGRLDPQIVGPIVGWAALWMASVAFLFIVAAVVILPFFIHTATRRN